MNKIDLLGAMRSFVRVYETGSFSAAARDLGMGQPSVSKAVASLEERLNAQLFMRSTRGLTPTDAGQKFYEHATRTLDEAELALKAVSGESAMLTGRLRVSSTITFMRQHIIPKLPIFFAQHPNLEIDLLLEDGNVGLVEEGIDVALRMGRLTSSNLTARRIGQCRRVVVATPDYFARHGTPQRPADLVDHPAIIFSRGEGGEHAAFVKGDKSQEVVLRPKLRISAMEGLRAAIMAGIGIGVSSEWIFTEELDDGRVCEALTDWAMPPLDLWAVMPGARHASPKARAFISFVEDQLRATRYGLR